MFDMEERELSKLNESLKDMPKPDNIDDYVKKGMALGIKRKKTNRIKMFSNIAAALLMAVFIISARTLPAFAEYVSKIPGLQYVVNLINYDKGLKSAVENNFIQRVNLSATHEDLTLTIKDVILDSSRGIIFYSIENKGNHKFVCLDNMKFLDEKGEHLKAFVTWSSFMDKDLSKDKTLEGKVEINFGEETVLPDKIYITATLKESDTPSSEQEHKETVLSSVWNYELPVDKEKIKEMQKTYALNQSIEVEGQKIMFKTVTITPTRIAVEIEYDKDNTKRIFRYDDMMLINEKGETFAKIINGASGSMKDENHETLYFQSNYFSSPKELYICGTSIRALDKDKCLVEVDLNNSKLLKAPNERLNLSRIETSSSSTKLEFTLKTDDPLDKLYHYSIFNHSIKDASGAMYQSSTSTSSDRSGMQSIVITLNKSLQGIARLYLPLEDYPERIKGNFKVRVK